MIYITFRWMKQDGEVEHETTRVEVIPRVGDEVLLNFDYFIVERVTHRIDTIDRHDTTILITLGASPEAGDLKRIEERAEKAIASREAEELAESTLRALSSMDDKLVRVVIDPPEPTLTEERLKYLIDLAHDEAEARQARDIASKRRAEADDEYLA